MQVFTCIMTGVDDDAVFKALADPTRRALLDRLRERNGQTLGKMALKTKLVSANGGPVEQSALIKRALVYPASGMVISGMAYLIPGLSTALVGLVALVYGIAMAIPIFTDPMRRGPHDKAANTVVTFTLTNCN